MVAAAMRAEAIQVKRRRIAALKHEIESLHDRGRREDAPRIVKLRRMIKRAEFELSQSSLF